MVRRAALGALLLTTPALATPPPDGITVVGRPEAEEAAADTSEAVEVVDTEEARTEAADMGAVLSRVRGMTARRSGGLGSRTLFSIHGLYGKRLRFFVDGLPIEAGGLGLGPADLPVGLIERVEIFKGVVPLRLGADALGGAIHFVTRQPDQDHIEGSTEIGSHGLFRGSLVADLRLEPDLGLYAATRAWFDQALNDYPVDVEVTDARGKLKPATVRRFHDAYEAHGLEVEVGLRGVAFADQLAATAFVQGSRKDVQSNPQGTVPYGDVEQGARSVGGRLRYRRASRPRAPLGVDASLAISQRDTAFDDFSHNLWSWYGEITRARPNPGERGRGERVRGRARHIAGRLGLDYRLAPGHRLELSAAPSHRRERRRRELTVEADVAPRTETHEELRVVSGLGYRAEVWDGRLENEAFAKHFHARPEARVVLAHGRRSDPRRSLGGGGRRRRAPDAAARPAPEGGVRVHGAAARGRGDLRRRRPARGQHGPAQRAQPQRQPGRRAGGSGLGHRPPRRLRPALLPPHARPHLPVPGARLRPLREHLRRRHPGRRPGRPLDGLLRPDPRRQRDVAGGHQPQRQRVVRALRGDPHPNLPYLFGNLEAVALPLPAARLERLRLYWYGRAVRHLFWESGGRKDGKLAVPDRFTQDVGVSLRSRGGRPDRHRRGAQRHGRGRLRQRGRAAPRPLASRGWRWRCDARAPAAGWRLVLGAAALVVAALAGAGTPLATTEGAAAPAGYTVELSPMGAVHFSRPPRRAVTLDAQYEDMLVALGVGDRLVATGYEGNHHDAFYAEIPGLTPGIDRAGLKLIGVGLDKELLYALRAEVHHIDPERLVAMPGWTRTDIAEITQNLGPFFANRYSREQSYPGDRPYTYYTAFELAARVGQVYQRGDRIAALEAIYDALVARIQVDLPPPEERPRVGLVTYARGHFTPFSVDRPGFGTAHLRAVGARDAFAAIRDRTYADAGRGTALDVEGLLALDPDVIIMPFAVFAS
ncbi:MAG: TonB-dependent receptor plug domain-containing protein, partial [bacterium]